MPIYDYECRNCGHRAEVIHGVNASGPSACERCGGPLRKLLTTPSIVFKGSGWAKKDRSTAGPTARSADAQGADGSTDSPGKSDSTNGTDAASAGTAADGQSEGKGKSDSNSDRKSESSGKKSESKAPPKDTTSTGGTRPTD